MIKRHLRSPKSWPSALLAVLCAAALVAAITGATRPLAASQFAQTGHWVYNSLLQMVFHIDGGTPNIDAQVPLQGQPGSQVVQGDTSGYVVGPGTITEFGKDSLTVRQTITPPADEVPLGIEVIGGPYLVFRNAGKIVRLGDPTATVSVGGAVGTPVVTEDGTMWLHRTGNGSICRLPRDARELSGCPVTVPGDHAGAMTMVDGRPAFVDLFTSTLHMIDGDKLGAGIPLGVPVSPNSRPATKDLAGRVAILDPQRPSLLIVDTKSPAAKSVTVALPPGEYDGPVSTGDVVAMVDRRTGTVMTYGADGARKHEKPIKQKAGTPRLSRGEDDRVYVEDADGTQVLVVAKDGNVQDVTVTGKQTAATQSPGTNQPDARVGPSVDQQRGRGEQQQRTTPPAVPAGRPGAPASVSAVAGSGSATVSWAAAPDNRAPITSYQVSWRASTGQTGAMTVGGRVRRTTVNGLGNGVSYVFTVTATNRVGTGPGASSGPATPNAPVSPAAAPVNLNATYDVNDRPTRNVTLRWGQPALNGGTLVHYEVTGTGLAVRQVTGTTVTYPQLQAANTYTFTVHAVTRTPAGQTLTGQPASAAHRGTQQTPTVTVSRGTTERYNSTCEVPECGKMRVVMRGFEPRKAYTIRPYSDAVYDNPGSTQTTDANGNVTFEAFHFGQVGARVWVVVDGRYQSNRYRWVSG